MRIMNLIDMLDVYAMLNDSDDMFYMLEDYTIDERIDRETLNKVIIKDLGTMRPITTDPNLYKILLDTFFDKYSLNITRLLDTMYLEYNPLNTKDLAEKEERHSGGKIRNTDGYGTKTSSEGKVSAYDSIDYQPKEITTGETSHNGHTNSDITSNVSTERTIHGKDGAGSYQKLIEQERKVAEFNIFNWIVKQMRRELFLLVY